MPYLARRVVIRKDEDEEDDRDAGLPEPARSKPPPRFETAFEQAFRARANQLGETVESLLRKLGVRNIDELERRVPWQQLENLLVGDVQPLVETQLQTAGTREVERLGLPMSFKLDNPYSRPWALRHSATLVRQVVEETRQAIRQTVARGFEEGKPPREMAREIRQVVGLTSRDAQAVRNYRATLALEGALPDEVDRKGDRYYQRLLGRRAVLIARTETIATHAAGTQQAWQVARDEGFMPVTARRVWIAGVGERTCPICSELNGQEAGLDEAFPGGVMLPPAHPACRCSVSLRA